MNRMLANAALAVLAATALPAVADVHKCQGPKGVTYSDGPCPANAQAIDYTPRDLLKDAPLPGQDVPAPRAGRAGPPSAPPAAAAHAGPVPDAPLPVWDTGLRMLEQVPGRTGWLDDDTLAGTTFGDARGRVAWMIRQVVAVDVRRRAVTPLVPEGFLDCTDPATGLMGIEVGNLEQRFAVRADAKAPVQRFLYWDGATHAATAVPADVAAATHAGACLRTAPEDVKADDWWQGSRALRYLQPKDGVIRWGMGADGRPEGPSLRNGTRKVMLDAATTDVAKQVRQLPFRHGYLLTPGHYAGIAHPESPLVVMTAEGKVTRSLLPASLRQSLEAMTPAAVATSWAVKPGLLVQVEGPAALGGGLYLAQGEKVARVWCTAGSGAAAACRIAEDPQVSPDGCHVAFDARDMASAATATLHVMDVCAAAPGAAARR